MKRKIHILILNYNGEELLRRFLPSVLREARRSRHDCRVSVVENQSSDLSLQVMAQYFPDVPVIVAPENKVLSSYNDVAKSLDEEILIFLNNDIEAKEGFVDELVEPFISKSDVFFVASHEDKSIIRSRYGIFGADFAYPEYAKTIERDGFSFCAGIGAFDRLKFLELGGYDELYLPGRYEDVDLCYQGWKRGWKGYYAAKSHKYHVGGASFDKVFGNRQTQRLVFRNSLLFMIKNIQDPVLMVKMVLGVALKLVAALLRGHWFIFGGLWDARKRLGMAIERRKASRRPGQMADEQVIQTINRMVRFHDR